MCVLAGHSVSAPQKTRPLSSWTCLPSPNSSLLRNIWVPLWKFYTGGQTGLQSKLNLWVCGTSWPMLISLGSQWWQHFWYWHWTSSCFCLCWQETCGQYFSGSDWFATCWVTFCWSPVRRGVGHPRHHYTWGCWLSCPLIPWLCPSPWSVLWCCCPGGSGISFFRLTEVHPGLSFLVVWAPFAEVCLGSLSDSWPQSHSGQALPPQEDYPDRGG